MASKLFHWQKLVIKFSFKVQQIWGGVGDMGIPFQCNKATRKSSTAWQERPCGREPSVVQLGSCCVSSRCSERTARQPEEVLAQQDRQSLHVFQVSTFLLSDRPSFITKSLQLKQNQMHQLNPFLAHTWGNILLTEIIT